jgi:hypothetical protein
MFQTKIEKTIILTDNAKDNADAVSRAIMCSNSEIYKRTMRSGGQYLIVEGKTAIEIVKNLPGYGEHVLCNRWQVVFIEHGCYKNCITVVYCGEYMKWILKRPKKKTKLNENEVEIPELVGTPTKTKQKDMQYIIHLEGVVK